MFPTRPQNPPRRPHVRAAFSLVEVTLALGLVAFALISVLGLMPVGLTTMREAMDQTTQSQISRRVAGEMMLTPFSKLDAWLANGPIYFDDQGEKQAAENGETRYSVEIRRGVSSFPGSSNETNLQGSLATFLIEIRRGSGPSAPFVSTNVVHIPNSGT